MQSIGQGENKSQNDKIVANNQDGVADARSNGLKRDTPCPFNAT